MEDEEDDGAGAFVPSEEEADWGQRLVSNCCSRSCARDTTPKEDKRKGCDGSLHIGPVMSQLAQATTARRKAGMMRVVHRVGAL